MQPSMSVSSDQSSPPPPSSTQAQMRQFTRQEVEARNNMNSAAIIIDNLVYDVTEFLEEHPGGAEVLLDNAGRDASQCFSDVGHSEIAHEWRNKFLVGEVISSERCPVSHRAPSSSLHMVQEPLTLASLLNVWGPPAALALLATVFYVYLF